MTQGMVVVIDGGQVVMKVVAGCNGMNAGVLAEAIRSERRIESARVFEMAECSYFGCPGCLVVVTKEAVTMSEGPVELSGDLVRYRETFNDARFNPRWENGSVEYLEIIEATLSQRGPNRWM